MTDGEVRFDGRAVIVTGGGRGLGRAEALMLASRGAKVVVADNGAAMDGDGNDRGPAEAVVAEIKAAGGEAVACTADISTEAGAAQPIEASMDAFGRVDGMIHGASTAPDLSKADELSTHDLDILMRVNGYAGLWLIRAAWPHLVKQHYGRIVLKTSAGFYGSFGLAHYAGAKATYIGMMRSLALEGSAHGILINCVAPSGRTRMTERFHDSPYAEWFFNTMLPEHVAAGATFLVSEECTLNGEIISLGGGRIARITIAENEGVLGIDPSIEDVRNAIPSALADTKFFYPADLAERSVKVASLFGFEGGLDASGSFAVKPVEKS